MDNLFDNLPLPGLEGPSRELGARLAGPASLPNLPPPDAFEEEMAPVDDVPQDDSPPDVGANAAPLDDGLRTDVAGRVARASWPGGTPFGPMPSEVELLDGLNPEQRQAVQHCGGPLLIVAGAGSGKTKVLTHRIAYQLATGRAHPGQILAITFTNKAAAEMRERVEALIGPAARGMWVSTFHSACVRILRREATILGLRSSFSIYDAADSLRLMTMVARQLDLDVKRHPPKGLLNRVSTLKNELVDEDDYAAQVSGAEENSHDAILASAYSLYQSRLRQAHALDFDDIIMSTVGLLQAFPAVAEHYRRRFRHVLVDEYQDTNHAQYVLVRELAGVTAKGEDRTAHAALPQAELTVVGDADQSIYAFRGATIRNIVEFEEDYPDATTILLEQNYRSTQTILSAANAVISRNPGRRAKNLWTASGAGPQIVAYVADDEHDEARFVAGEIDRLSDTEGIRPADVAIFYRANAQSRALEEVLIRVGLPYKVVGGTRFYERREIKDAIAYLRAIANPDDAVNLRRIINVPKRGIGDRAEGALAALADRERISFGDAIARADEAPGIATRSLTAVRRFAELMDGLRELAEGPETVEEVEAAEVADGDEVEAAGAVEEAELADGADGADAAEAIEPADYGVGPAVILEAVLDRTGYLAELRESSDPQDESRVENLSELVAVAQEFEQLAPGGTLGDFLERVSLVADSDQIPTEGEDDGVVTLMTLHTAKGLEFPVVFLTGLEDGTFPHQRSMAEESELAEERRLAYVGLTRARERIYLSRAAVRSAWGQPMAFPQSRFFDDLPEELVDWRRRESSTAFMRRAGESDLWERAGGTRSGGSSFSGGFGTSVAGGSQRGGGGEKTLGILRPSSNESGGGPSQVKATGPVTDGSGVSLSIGDAVTHDTYGLGTVVELEGGGRNAVAKIEFRGEGVKRLLLRYSPVTKL